MKEWLFKEDSENVDIDRIYEELEFHPVLIVQSYLNELKKNAPEVYKRFRNKYKGILGCIKIEPICPICEDELRGCTYCIERFIHT